MLLEVAFNTNQSITTLCGVSLVSEVKRFMTHKCMTFDWFKKLDVHCTCVNTFLC